MKDLSVYTKLWINSKDEMLLGEGRVALLEAIKAYGSINKAAKSMNMSYTKAWKLVDTMNGATNKPLVETSSGGQGGGGTQLTEEGEKAVELYNSIIHSAQNFVRKELKRIKIELKC